MTNTRIRWEKLAEELEKLRTTAIEGRQQGEEGMSKGESFLYLGRTYRLSLVSSLNQPLQLKDGRFCLSRELVEQGGAEGAKQAFASYLTAKGLQRFTERVALFAPKVGVKVSNIKVKEMGYRWASCGKAGFKVES